MRRIHTFIRGCLEGTGVTKTEAKSNLDRQVDWACSYQPAYLESYFRYLIAITPNAYGYSSMAVSPEKLQHGQVHSATTFVGRGPINAEVHRMRVHVAQLAWSADKHDAEHIREAALDDQGRSELVRWIEFQRLYARHIEAGSTPAQAHEQAARGVPVN